MKARRSHTCALSALEEFVDDEIDDVELRDAATGPVWISLITNTYFNTIYIWGSYRGRNVARCSIVP